MGTPPSNLVEFAYKDLQGKIINGKFEAKQRLVISSLAKGYGISAIPIREALAKLSTVGIVEFTPNHGYRVAPHLDKQGFIELFEARLMLDLAAVPEVLANATDSDIKELKVINSQIANHQYSTKRYTQFQRFMTLNSKFHRKFLEIANNRFFEQLYDDLDTEMFISRHIINSNIVFDELIHGHDEILIALQERNATELRMKLIQHLTEGINLIFGYKEKLIIKPLL